MFKDKRSEEIKSRIIEKGQASVEELSKLFGVSCVTIRNDLTTLENEGFLIRTRGGAVIKEMRPYLVNESWNTQNMIATIGKKRRIAEIAEKQIMDGMWIYLSSGTTCYEIGKQILNRTLNIVTAGLETAIELSKSKSLEILIPGGNLIRGNGFSFLGGDWYLRSLDEMRFDQAYVGVSGVDIESGFTVNSALEYSLIEKIKEVSRETIVVADSTKFDHRAFMPVAGLTYADKIITNNDIPDKYRKYFSEHNIKFLTD
jgi:DeoR family transcriptional regulator, fructose operon transcriptional repressor